ncbi:hypothetical protein F4778DRAFT_467511 [Xylariomycetidae sp. FL2044]|nr:hypothetical protein F4778DRAFT_467511 [Xylariomycetidae sp. FL2044]
MASLFKSTTTYDPIFCLLNAEDQDERDEMTERWKENKLQELNFVGIVGALLAGVLTSTGSWPTILPNGTLSPWTVRACWYCGILLALTSVLTAAQQSIRLHRLSCHRRPHVAIRRLLRSRQVSREGKALPRRAQVFMWQMSGLILSASVFAMLTGMFILIWSSTGGLSALRQGWWNGDAKMAVTFSAVALLLGLGFLYEQYTMYSWHGADDSQDDVVH